MNRKIVVFGCILAVFLMLMTPCLSAANPVINDKYLNNNKLETIDEHNWRLYGFLGLIKYTILFLPYSILLGLIFASFGFKYGLEQGLPAIRAFAGVILSPITVTYLILKMCLMIIYNDAETPYGPLCIFLQNLITKFANFTGLNVYFDVIFG